MGQYLIDELVRSQRIVAFMVSSRGLITGLEKVLKETKTKDGLYKSLTELFCGDNKEHSLQAVPSSLLRDEMSLRGLKDALYYSLRVGNQKAILAIDELDDNRVVHDALRRIHSEIESFDIHLILISRGTKRDRSQHPSRKYVQCQLWKPNEAKQILEGWYAEQGLYPVAIFDRGWIAEQATFSLYLIHAIFEHIDDLGNEPSALLTKAINAHLRSVTLELRPYLRRAPIQLEQIRVMLAEK